MPEKALEQVTPPCAELFQNALAAMKRKEVEAAIPDFLLALDLEPGFFECREALRQAEEGVNIKPQSFLKVALRRLRQVPLLIWIGMVRHFRPLRAISLSEQILAQDPTNATAHTLLAKAAMTAHLPRTAVLSLKAIPTETRAIQLQLAKALAQSGDESAAAALYGQMLKDNPSDRTVLRKLGHRVLHPDAVVELEKFHRPSAEGNASPANSRASFGKNLESDDATITRCESLLVHCPRNIQILKSLAEAYEHKKMYDKALNYYQCALKVAAGDNATAVRKAISETTLKKFDAALAKLDSNLPGNETRREELQHRRLEYQRNTMGWPV